MMEEVDLADTPLAMRPQLQGQDSTSVSDEEPPDPRIQVELERLNTSTDLINKLEVDLDEARMMFRQTLLESTQQIDNLTKKLGKCVEQARPYYEARIKAKQALTEAQKSAVRYERAVSQHAAAREMVHLAEEGLLTRGCIFDSTWQEMLNHATTKVNDAEREKIESTSEHREKSTVYHESETRVKVLQKELKRCIAKSSLNARRSLLQLTNIIRMHELQLLPYFELKAAVNQRLEEQKRHVRELEAAVASAKSNYAQALTNLETISDQIHKNRQSRQDLGIRGVGVGAESPGPPCSKTENEIAKEKSLKNSLEKNPQIETTISSDLSHTTSSNRNTVSTCNSSQQLPFTDNIKNGDNFQCTLKTAASDLESCTAELENREISLSASTITISNACHDAEIGGEDDTACIPNEVKNNEENGLNGAVPPMGEMSEQQGSYLAGWQFVAFSGLPQTLLPVDDRESTVSDSESLTSIEMLSEEAIANLMLEDEINEATHSICSPHFTEEYLAPPTSCKAGGSLPFISTGLTKNVGEEKNASQTSSSDSGEPWEVVSDSQEPLTEPTDGKGETLPVLDPSTKKGLNTGECYMRVIEPVDAMESPSKDMRKTSSAPTELASKISETSFSVYLTEASDNDRPQSLAVSSSFSKSSKSTSSSSSSLNSNSFSETFSPSYAPLSDTPDIDSNLVGITKSESMTSAENHRQDSS